MGPRAPFRQQSFRAPADTGDLHGRDIRARAHRWHGRHRIHRIWTHRNPPDTECGWGESDLLVNTRSCGEACNLVVANRRAPSRAGGETGAAVVMLTAQWLSRRNSGHFTDLASPESGQ